MQQVNNSKIRIAVMWNGSFLYAWQHRALDMALSLPFAEPVLLIQPDDHHPPVHKPSLLYRAFRKFTSPSAEFEKMPLPERLANTARISCLTEKKGHRERFSAEDIQQIKAANPDLIIRFGFNILSGDILTVARYGVISYHHGDPEKYRGGPPLFWEMLKGENTAGAVLQRLTETLDGGILLRRGTFSIQQHSFKSTYATLLQVSTAWIAQHLTALYYNTFVPHAAVYQESRFYSWPGNTQVFRLWTKLLSARIKFYMTKYFLSEDWNICLLPVSLEEIAEGTKIQQPEFYAMERRHLFKADPFCYSHKGRLYLLYEQYDYWKGRGTIVRNRLLAPDSKPEEVLQVSHHHSYPYTFEHEGRTYCVPESAAAAQVVLYELDSENRFREKHILLDNFQAADPSLVYYENQWWLFCTSPRRDGANRDLYIFHAPSLDAPFEPHSLNPVLNDVRFARPAGTMFIHQQKLFRPVQDSSNGYGSAVHIMEVTKLSHTAFDQQLIRSIRPFSTGRYRSGIHTLSAAGAHTLADSSRKIFRFSSLFLKLRHIFTKD